MAKRKTSRESLIKKAFNKAVKKWRDSDGDISAFEVFDELLEKMNFPVNYISKEVGEWDVLTVAFLNESEKIEFLSLTF